MTPRRGETLELPRVWRREKKCVYNGANPSWTLCFGRNTFVNINTSPSAPHTRGLWLNRDDERGATVPERLTADTNPGGAIPAAEIFQDRVYGAMAAEMYGATVQPSKSLWFTVSVSTGSVAKLAAPAWR